MDTLTIIVITVTTGATSTAESAIRDVYANLKRLLRDRYGSESGVAEAVAKIEARLDTEWPKVMLREELEAAGAAQDAALLRAA